MVVQPSLSFKAPKEKIATKRLPSLLISSMRDGYEHITGVPSGIINGKEVSNYDFKDYKNTVDSPLL